MLTPPTKRRALPKEVRDAALAITRSRSHVWTVTFDNPPVNRLDPELILELQALVDQLEHDPDVAVVVFDSANVDHFLGPYDMSRAAASARSSRWPAIYDSPVSSGRR